jgi:hypothetical protein
MGLGKVVQTPEPASETHCQLLGLQQMGMSSTGSQKRIITVTVEGDIRGYLWPFRK